MSELWRRIVFLFRRRQFDRELDEEMRVHLEMKAETQGEPAARRQFGNVNAAQGGIEPGGPKSGHERSGEYGQDQGP